MRIKTQVEKLPQSCYKGEALHENTVERLTGYMDYIEITKALLEKCNMKYMYIGGGVV